MRLLQLKDNDEIHLVEFIGDQIPPYAILSHTWGSNDSEVSYKDIVEGVGKNKAGYKKIISCGRRALTKKLEYFWVDTCAIDKSSSAELSEAINSMYRWYRNAKICFAYLEDVRPDQDISTWSTTTVRWFSRGWTLQELIASPNLEFFANDWTLLGSKASCCEQLAAITGIHSQALAVNRPIRTFSIAQRMSWASSRSTTRPEDMAYCLLGLFDVNMPLLYGEGARNAFLRLQEGIMKDSDDRSLFAWTQPRQDHITFRGLLADSPADFAQSRAIIPISDGAAIGTYPYEVTNAGVRMALLIGPLETTLSSHGD
ncbi:heterokaryon incompatibility protein-domain-containing protein [Paraphoma chrysanthemicola]|uniref:Heterokaryon incompatibility protein-domain-containing protein n=1 Tax=Paraphoma chrysanthemicola TaxID=798071 RepID=A0A8K0QXR5_9PLEO|nr:heterokaryon incompatibility protein-domain-containing protein [Paraphoma chrysanthemicola]